MPTPCRALRRPLVPRSGVRTIRIAPPNPDEQKTLTAETRPRPSFSLSLRAASSSHPVAYRPVATFREVDGLSKDTGTPPPTPPHPPCMRILDFRDRGAGRWGPIPCTRQHSAPLEINPALCNAPCSRRGRNSDGSWWRDAAGDRSGARRPAQRVIPQYAPCLVRPRAIGASSANHRWRATDGARARGSGDGRRLAPSGLSRDAGCEPPVHGPCVALYGESDGLRSTWSGNSARAKCNSRTLPHRAPSLLFRQSESSVARARTAATTRCPGGPGISGERGSAAPGTGPGAAVPASPGQRLSRARRVPARFQGGDQGGIRNRRRPPCRLSRVDAAPVASARAGSRGPPDTPQQTGATGTRVTSSPVTTPEQGAQGLSAAGSLLSSRWLGAWTEGGGGGGRGGAGDGVRSRHEARRWHA